MVVRAIELVNSINNQAVYTYIIAKTHPSIVSYASVEEQDELVITH